MGDQIHKTVNNKRIGLLKLSMNFTFFPMEPPLRSPPPRSVSSIHVGMGQPRGGGSRWTGGGEKRQKRVGGAGN